MQTGCPAQPLSDSFCLAWVQSMEGSQTYMLNSGLLTGDVKVAMRQKMQAFWSHYVLTELRGLKGDMRQSHYVIICLVNTCKIYAHFDYCKFFKIVPPGLYNMLPRLSVFTAVFRNPKGRYTVVWENNMFVSMCVHVHVCLQAATNRM